MSNKKWNKIGYISVAVGFAVIFGGILIIGDSSNGFEMVDAPRLPAYIWLSILVILVLLTIFSFVRAYTGKLNLKTFALTVLVLMAALTLYSLVKLI